MNNSLTVVIPYWNKEDLLKDVIQNALLLNPIEVIVVKPENKNVDSIELTSNKKIIFVEWNKVNSPYDKAFTKARGEILLFIDGNILYKMSELLTFIQPIATGNSDLVLRDLNPLIMKGEVLSPLMVWCQNINEIIGHTDLGINNILSFPCALKKRSVTSLNMKNPIVSYLELIQKGTKISKSFVTQREGLFKVRPFSHEEESTYHNWILDAVGQWLEVKGKRGALSDGGKRLDILEDLKAKKGPLNCSSGWGTQSSFYKGKKLSIIIPAQDEELTIGEVIQESRKLEPYEIIVVVNGSTDKTAEIAKNLGATVVEYHERLGHNVGRSIGAYISKGDILLFIDADFPIRTKELLPFATSICNGVDMALNDLNSLLPIQFPLHNVSAFKYGLNILLDKELLGIGSLLAVPHALSRSCLEHIGFESLACPSLAQVKAIEGGYTVSCVQQVDVLRPNKIRPEQHLGSYIHGGSRQYVLEKIYADPKYTSNKVKFENHKPIQMGWGCFSSLYQGKQLSVIIAAQNAAQTIEQVINKARKIEPLEIIVVLTGSTDNTEEVVKKLGVTLFVFKENIGLGQARYIGALSSKGDIINFVDSSQKGQTPAEQRIIGDHLEAISHFIHRRKKPNN
ncbi:glycosyltransferase family 2 protein [Robertmurraya sp. P23]|uniref:glycosyltransferase family 2 protein n=1 Tax=Robertmurraya sp. P23 TaxID=3436931 RepID=UPI003D966364